MKYLSQQSQYQILSNMEIIVRIIIVAVVFLLIGCASVPSVQDYADKSEWNAAYNRFFTSTVNADTIERERIAAIANKYPEIGESGIKEFSIERLQSRAKIPGGLNFPKASVDRFCMIVSAEQCGIAIDNVAAVQATIKPDTWVIKGLHDKLTADERSKLSAKYTVIFYDDNDIGIVTDRQVQNISTPGSNAGTAAGAAAGSAVYNINSVSSSNPKNWTYSPASDLGAAILGAMIGSAANVRPVELYRIRYTVKTRDGQIAYKEVESSSPLGHSPGVCIDIRQVAVIDQEFCTMDLQALKVLIAKQT